MRRFTFYSFYFAVALFTFLRRTWQMFHFCFIFTYLFDFLLSIFLKLCNLFSFHFFTSLFLFLLEPVFLCSLLLFVFGFFRGLALVHFFIDRCFCFSCYLLCQSTFKSFIGFVLICFITNLKKFYFQKFWLLYNCRLFYFMFLLLDF